jgi:predicted MPP superfamily phosphohydrolase
MKSLKLLPFLSIVIFFFFLNVYVLSGVHVLSKSPLMTPLFWSVVLFITAALIYSIRSIQRLGMGMFFKISTHAFLILFTSELVFAFLLLLSDIFRQFTGAARSLKWTEFAAIVFLLTVLTFIYGMIRGKYAYRVIRHTLFFEDLPASFDGFTITQISDIHAGSFNNPKAVQRGIDMVKTQQSDLFVFTGDLVNNKASEIQPWISAFSQIKAPYGQFSILGNHDYGDYVKWPSDHEKQKNLQELKLHHAEMGFRLLMDESVPLYKNGEKIILAGIENWGVGFGERGDLKKALNHTDATEFKILLSHDPSHWEAEVKNFPSKIQLTLSGHTHGMQFGLEAFGIKWSPAKYRYAHWAGIKQENNRYININRGFGFIGFSGRIGIWPEITVIELKKAVKKD